MNILLDGLFYNGSGFAEDNRNLLHVLDGLGHQVRIHPRDKSEKHLVSWDEEIYLQEKEVTILASNDLYICNIMGSAINFNPTFKINIARTMFETDRIPGFWVPHLNRFNEVWVPGMFNYRTFRESGVEAPMKIIPSYIEPSLYTPNGESLDLGIREKFVFLSIFDWQERKGYDLLLQAFLEEFSVEDSVALLIKTHSSDRAKNPLIDAQKFIEKFKSDTSASVYLLLEPLNTNELVALYRSSDAFVLPSRGEGWGRPYFEAMLMERPTIGTDWSGQTAFMHQNNSFLIGVEGLVSISSGHPIFEGHRWAQPSLSELKRTMRFVVENPDVSGQKAAYARADLLEHFGLDVFTECVRHELSKYHLE